MDWAAFFYDEQVVPLLRRMSNLEELSLLLSFIRFNSTFIDGKQLYNDFLMYMTKLQTFSFSIHTQLINQNVRIKLPSANDLRNSFFELGYKHIDAFADGDFINDRADCHVYSVPYKFKDFYFMTSAFQGGKFDRVQQLEMYDRRPFEHRLFEIIARDFPFLRRLLITNLNQQQVKDHPCARITFGHLCELYLGATHIDYAVGFLSNRIINLPRLTNLSIKYEALATATKSFTNDETRLACNRITGLYIRESFVRPENFHWYFPLLQMNCVNKETFY